FNPDCLRELVDQHQSGRADHSTALWSLTMFEAFLRVVVDGPHPVVPDHAIASNAPAHATPPAVS
ncbi:MAG TPA: hypothetical protein VK195_04305, partial [Burkholderiaceae bacterium]|nr:hypothetical protein [Burkholderiaceae bacterium]